MDAWSVKSVPGCLVLIVPRLIGEPVAFVPGLDPQDDVSTLPEPPLLLLVAPAAALDVAPLPPPLGVEFPPPLLLLPQAARAITATSAAANMTARRNWRRGTRSPRLISLLLLECRRALR